jgi:hypothetical protein
MVQAWAMLLETTVNKITTTEIVGMTHTMEITHKMK